MPKIIVIFFALTFFSAPMPAQERLVFSAVENVLFSDLSSTILKKAYNSIGISIDYMEYPARRALYSSNMGETDGELFRIKGIDKDYPNLIMIPIPILTTEWVVFSKNKDIKVDGFSSLRPYKIAHRGGIKIAEYETEGMDRIIVDSLEHAFLLLHRGLVDVVISSRIVGLQILKRLNYENIEALSPPLTTVNLYHYLHKKHEALVPEITNELTKMQEAGDILKERNYFTHQLLNK